MRDRLEAWTWQWYLVMPALTVAMAALVEYLYPGPWRFFFDWTTLIGPIFAGLCAATGINLRARRDRIIQERIDEVRRRTSKG